MPHRILVVDDDRAVRDLITHALAPPEFEVHAFARASEALTRLPEIEPQLIVSDIMMPDMDGREFFSRLRSDPTALVVPFIFLTAVRSAPQTAALLAAGAADYLVKPFPVSELVAKVRGYLGIKPERPAPLESTQAVSQPRSAASHYDLRLPRGRFSIVTVAGRRLQVLTEVQPGPSYTVVTVVAEDGRGVCRTETTWRNPLRREADFVLAGRQLDIEHERTLRSLPELISEGAPRRELWSDERGVRSSAGWRRL